MKCDDSKPASNVYYHQIVPRGSEVPFVLYTEYLSNIATKYPLLKFNVIFLVDDIYPELARGVNRHHPAYQSRFYNYKLDDFGKEPYNEFIRRYQNVNVTIVSLSKYMAKTPLKYKWRLIPQAHLSFYARVYSVWRNGGIGMDLRSFNNNYHNGQFADSRIDAILGQHNDGINPTTYTKALNKIDQDEASAIFNMFTGIINNFLNETRSFFNRPLPFISFNSNENSSLVRTHRSKRELHNLSELSTIVESSYSPRDFYNIDIVLNETTTDKQDKTKIGDFSTFATTANEKSNITDLKINKTIINGSETRQMVMFYDFSIMSDSLVNPFSPLFTQKSSVVSKKTVPHLLSIDTEGTFIAASSKLHPFLGHLSSAGYFGIHPKYAIQDAFLTQCSGVLKEDVYCNNIYIL